MNLAQNFQFEVHRIEAQEKFADTTGEFDVLTPQQRVHKLQQSGLRLPPLGSGLPAGSQESWQPDHAPSPFLHYKRKKTKLAK